MAARNCLEVWLTFFSLDFFLSWNCFISCRFLDRYCIFGSVLPVLNWMVRGEIYLFYSQCLIIFSYKFRVEFHFFHPHILLVCFLLNLVLSSFLLFLQKLFKFLFSRIIWPFKTVLAFYLLKCFPYFITEFSQKYWIVRSFQFI